MNIVEILIVGLKNLRKNKGGWNLKIVEVIDNCKFDYIIFDMFTFIVSVFI